MKKLLIFILTIILVACITITNKRISKAHENKTYSYYYDAGNAVWTGEDGVPGTVTYNVDDKLTFNTNFPDWALAIFVNGFSESIPYEHVVKNQEISVECDTKPAWQTVTCTIKDLSPSFRECDGIRFLGNGWKNGDTVITEQELKDGFGIDYNKDLKTIRLSNSLFCTTYFPLSIGGELTLILDDNITMFAPSSPLHIAGIGSTDIKIDGNNKSLTLKTRDETTISDYRSGAASLIFSNITLICENDTISTPTLSMERLKLGDNCIFEITNKTTDPTQCALKVTEEPEPDVYARYDFFGSIDGNNIDLQPAIWNSDTNMFSVENESNELTPARYMLIKPKLQPKPSPSEPVVKDESCEKVIGPTWHWNESKGICEDYGVVGTSTR